MTTYLWETCIKSAHQLLQKGELAEAAQTLESGVEVARDFADPGPLMQTLQQLSSVRLMQYQFQEAVEASEEAWQTSHLLEHPDDQAMALLTYVFALNSVGNYGTSWEVLGEYSSLEPQKPELGMDLAIVRAEVALKTDRCQLAIDALTPLLENPPESLDLETVIRCQKILALAYAVTQRHETSLEFLNTVVEGYRELYSEDESYIDSILDFAEDFYQVGYPQVSWSLIQVLGALAVAIAPLRTYSLTSHIALSLGLFQEAEAASRNLVEWHKSQERSLEAILAERNAALILQAQEQWVEAESLLEQQSKALSELLPLSHNARQSLRQDRLQGLRRLKEYDKARALCQDWVEKGKEEKVDDGLWWAELYVDIGLLEYGSGDLEAAESAFIEAHALLLRLPDAEELLCANSLNLATCLAEMNKQAQAREFLSLALERKPSLGSQLGDTLSDLWAEK